MSLKSATIMGPWEPAPASWTDAASGYIPAWLAVLQPDPTQPPLYALGPFRDTGQKNIPPSPNICTWTIDLVDEAGLTALENDPQGRFTILSESDAIT